MTETQDHIHLDLYFPTGTQLMRYKYSAVRNIQPNSQVIGSYARTLTGAPVSHVLKTAGGSVLRFTDYQYELRLTIDDYEFIRNSFLGVVCILVDVRHVADASNHVPYYKKVLLTNLRFLKVLSPELGDILASVEFIDFYTVAPV